MALLNSKEYQPEMKRNEPTNGLIKIGQFQLSSISSTPTLNLADGRIFYNSTDHLFKVYVNGAWKTITAA
jgi:hypothetical protein